VRLEVYASGLAGTGALAAVDALALIDDWTYQGETAQET
jgi:hypothetical protein